MQYYIILRLYPDQPVNGTDFTSYLPGLSIQVFDRSFSQPDGVSIGPAITSITQHSWADTFSVIHWESVATAWIQLPTGLAEYQSPDLKVIVSRSGKLLQEYDWNYNVAILKSSAPPTTLSSASLYLAIPAPGQELDPSVANINLPTNGTPPKFDDLATAINAVVAQDPTGTPDLSALTPAQCLHLAYEITWNRSLYPMPQPPSNPVQNLEEMYTLDYVPPIGASARNAGDADNAIRDFSSANLSYQAQRKNAATQLSQYISAYSAALACEKTSQNATSALLRVPIHTASNSHPDKITEVDINISFGTPLSFAVPAAYFYALTASLPDSMGPDARYQQACTNDPAANVAALQSAISAGTILPNNPNPAQAARRLHALGGQNGAPVALVNTPATIQLVTQWLAFTPDDIENFWTMAVASPPPVGTVGGPHLTGQLELILEVVTDDQLTLVQAIMGVPPSFVPGFPVSNVDQLTNFTDTSGNVSGITENAWRKFFTNDPPNTPNPKVRLLSPTLLPGASDDEKITAFINGLRKFYNVVRKAEDLPVPSPALPPQLSAPPADLIHQFLALNPGFSFTAANDPVQTAAHISTFAPGDACVQQWLTQVIQTATDLYKIAGAVPAELAFSVMEALYARGFTSKAGVQKMDSDDFKASLTGTVAFPYADALYKEAVGTSAEQNHETETFQPINPDGLLTNCIPPAHLSPLGPVAYLHEVLQVSGASTCANPRPADGPAIANSTLVSLLASRRGPLGDLAVTQANLETPLPMIDLVNECLEAMVAGSTHGVVYDTASTILAGHKLRPPSSQKEAAREFHDPVVLLGAMPEHSSPATPVASTQAYDKLRQDFSAPSLPYSQALDVNRHYLKHLGTSRFEVMKNFRKEIREFLHDPANEPAGFERHVARKPYRTELFCEYLGISPEEYSALFTGAFAPVSTLYGYSSAAPGWTKDVAQLPEFLKRTGLSYCEFTELWKSHFVQSQFPERKDPQVFPACEPCCLKDLSITLVETKGENGVIHSAEPFLLRLAVFIRLWRKLQALPCARYSFAQLSDICGVLELFHANGRINTDFIRQLAAFQMLRDDLCLPLSDREDRGAPPNATGADRTHLLALWVPAAAGQHARKYEWAVGQLLHHLQGFAQSHHGCECRTPEFIKLLQENLQPLATLSGANPWDSKPTHTLRFAEVLAKIYASRFTVGEILFIFTDLAHLDGNDPFALASAEESSDSPLELPDDEEQFSLWALRRKLLAVGPCETDAAEWTWARIEASLKHQFGYVESSSSGVDPLTSLGQHFFPSILRQEGYAVPGGSWQYRAPLPGQSSAMWNTPLHGPFRYDSDSPGNLWTQLPLQDGAVLAKLSAVRQLNPAERDAIRDLYFLPRVELARFAFIFHNFGEAERCLIQEENENERWEFFQREFARLHQRCKLIAEHLADHGAGEYSCVEEDCHQESHRRESSHYEFREGGSCDEESRQKESCEKESHGRELCDHESHDKEFHQKSSRHREREERIARAWEVLKHLLADENQAKSSWEDDSGKTPQVTWPQPSGGAFAALLGLTGTGLASEFRVSGNPQVVWREPRGGMRAFSKIHNEWNAPIPTLIPAMDLAISPEAQQFSGVRNGLGFANANGRQLGGLQDFSVTWEGALLVEKPGRYQFWAGMPSEAGQPPEPPEEGGCRWRLVLKRGQKVLVMLSHQWREQETPVFCAGEVALQRGVYHLKIEFEQPQPWHLRDQDICPQKTGFQVKYKGPDTQGCIETLPYDRLFQERKDQQLSGSLKLTGEASAFLGSLYTSSLRDIRRTYERALKAFLFADRFCLSAQGVSYAGHSELGYFLGNPSQFAGTAYYLAGGVYKPHLAGLNFNFLPVDDNYSPEFDYTPPTAVADERIHPQVQRCQALFDLWERTFDYSALRRATRNAPERPVWLLFHEASENQPDQPHELLAHLRVDFSHSQAVLDYYSGYAVATADLEDERWPVRAWRADRLVSGVMASFFTKDIRDVRPDLWAADVPADLAAGNANLTQFVCDGSFENHGPQRYQHIKVLNDGLRERARAALVAYLCAMDRVTLPDGGKAREARHLSELLLLDVEVGVCEKASRIEEAITAIELFVQRARLGLEPGFKPGREFLLLWDRHFAAFRTWEACKRREVYGENWVEWEELEKARQTEAFRFLEDQLRRGSLTSPAPGGSEYWPPKQLPRHSGTALIQKKEPSTLQPIDLPREGLGLMGVPERQARSSWLARLDSSTIASPASQSSAATGNGRVPLWIEAAIRMGTRFVRVAAAGIPPASLDICHANGHSGCCVECGKTHDPFLDEYYFWLIDSRHFSEPTSSKPYQDPLWPWHDQKQLPTLLHWESEPMVHLAWCRIHNSEFQQPRRSSEGVRKDMTSGSAPFDLVFTGRTGDSLRFEVTGGVAPSGFPPSSAAGFRYDMATDSAMVLPLVVNEPTPAPVAGLAAFPFFLYFCPGASLYPESSFSPSVAIGDHLRAHCRFEEALKWYACAYPPLERNNQWAKCLPKPVIEQMPPKIMTEALLVNGVPQGVVTPALPSAVTPALSTASSALPTVTPALSPVSPSGIGVDLPPRLQPAWPPPSESKCCDSTAVQGEDVVRNRAITLRYIETLLQWADGLMCQNTPEAFQKARLVLDTATKIMGDAPRTIAERAELQTPPLKVAAFAPHIPPLNPRLLSLWEKVEQRMSLIHSCFNGRRLHSGAPDKDMPYWGNSTLHDGWKSSVNACEDDGCCSCCKPYRFTVLVKQAQDLANEVKGLGSALLAAYEKGDSEYLASLRSVHENQLHALTLSIRENQWRDSDWQVQALQKTKESAQLRRTYNNNLFIANLIALEQLHESQSLSAINWRLSSNIAEVFSQVLRFVNDFYIGQNNFQHVPLGSKLADAGSALSRAYGAMSDYYGSEASLNLTRAGWERREVEWGHQVQVLDIEIQQIEDQILGAERRRDAALQELNNLQRQMEQSGEVLDFLRDKFTNDALYLWMQKETAALYSKAYELALQAARSAQRAFNIERGHTARSFIPQDAWDNLHEGLLAGDRLQVALKHMEKAYYDENCREYELSKHISLRLHSPIALLQLKATGRCEIELPEWLFDHDYPGQYMRRIRSVSLTLPCVAGPYVGVHCRLTLLSSSTRIDPRLSDKGAACCTKLPGCGCGNGYVTTPDDARMVRQYSAVEAVATSSGQNDSGLFELNFRDERYLPFEYAGTVSRWRIELPPENNYFDLDSLSDAVLHLNYTAREGGKVLRDAAQCEAEKHLPGNGLRLFDARHDFPNAWHVFTDRQEADQCRQLELRFSRAMFPFVPQSPSLRVEGLHIFFEAGCATPSGFLTIEFLEHEPDHRHSRECRCKPRKIECVASSEWPHLFHGVLGLNDLPLESNCDLRIGSLKFPEDSPEITRLYLVAGYRRCEPAPCICEGNVPALTREAGTTRQWQAASAGR